MARKTRTSKKAQENNESSKKDTADPVDTDTEGPSTGTESDLTQPVPETADTSTDASSDQPSAKTSEEMNELSAADTEDKSMSDGSDGDAPSDNDSTDGSSDAAVAVSDADTAPAEDAEPVGTTVAGVVPAQSDQTSPTPPPTSPPPPSRSSTTFPLVFGGLVAGAIGFLVATFAVPEGWPNPPSEAPDTETAARVDALAGDLADLTERLDALPQTDATAAASETVDLAPVRERLDAIEGETGSLRDAIAALEQTVSDLSARVDEVAAAPAIVSPDGSAAMEAQLEAFRRDLDAVTEAARAEIEEAQSRASQIEADAAAAAAEAARNAAKAEVRAALESGEPFADALDALGDVPDALADVADDGVTQMATLQDRFPDAARAALQEVQSVPEDASPTDRMASFLRRHTNARSLAPRDGDDPDAVLSRAEAALSSGDLDAALTELDALPDDASSALQGWIDEARARASAVAAMNEME